MDVPKPHVGSFLESMNLQLSRYLLSRVGSKRHEIGFVTPVDAPFRVPTTGEIRRENLSDERLHYRLVHRNISFRDLGILCSSATRPSLREITLRAEIEGGTPIEFGPNTTLREGFEGEETEFGTGSIYCSRHDFTKRTGPMDQKSELLVLEPGIVHYPFGMDGTGIYESELAKNQKRELDGKTVPSSLELDDLETNFDRVNSMIRTDVVVVLDSGELLTFHWDHDEQRFSDDFFNAGLAAA